MAKPKKMVKDHRFKNDYKSRINGSVHGFHNIKASFEIPYEDIEVNETHSIELVDDLIKMEVSLRLGESIYSRLKGSRFTFNLLHEHLNENSPLIKQKFDCSDMKRNFKFSRGSISMVTLIFSVMRSWNNAKN